MRNPYNMNIVPKEQGTTIDTGLMEKTTMTIIVGACLAAGATILVFLTGGLSSTNAQIVFSAWYAAYCTSFCLAGFYCFMQGKARQLLGKTTILLSAASLLLGLALIWAVFSSSGLLARLAFIAALFMFASGHASLMLSRLRRDEAPLATNLTWAAVTLVSGLALFFSGLVIVSPGNLATIIWRLVGSVFVLAVLSTILATLLRLGKQATTPDP